MATLAEIQARLNEYRTAESRILKNQSYTIGTRTFTMANLKSVQAEIKKLEAQLKGASGTATMRVRRVMFRDD